MDYQYLVTKAENGVKFKRLNHYISCLFNCKVTKICKRYCVISSYYCDSHGDMLGSYFNHPSPCCSAPSLFVKHSMNSMKTCNSVTFYFVNNSFSDISRKWILSNMIRAVPALITSSVSVLDEQIDT